MKEIIKKSILPFSAREKAFFIIPFRLEVAACPASLLGRVKSFIFIARPSVAHPIKG